jgi:hypothetical protein
MKITASDAVWDYLNDGKLAGRNVDECGDFRPLAHKVVIIFNNCNPTCYHNDVKKKKKKKRKRKKDSQSNTMLTFLPHEKNVREGEIV